MIRVTNNSKVIIIRAGTVFYPGRALEFAKPSEQKRRKLEGCSHLTVEDVTLASEYPYTGTLSAETKIKANPRGTATIIIPVHNRPDMLQRCLDSLNETTDAKVIIIDNGSDKDTKDLIAKSGCKVITNKKNHGFAFACNQGIKASKGNVCLLNSDTVVTDGWLDGLIDALNGDFGIVGPTTNYASGPQCDRSLMRRTKKHKYTDEEIQELANKYLKFSGERVNVPELVGFCLLIDSRVIEQIGGFDTTFGMGGGEETSFNGRAKMIGWKLGWVKGVFVHHEGHATMLDMVDRGEAKSLEDFDKYSFYLKLKKELESGKRPIKFDINYKSKPGPLLNILTRTHGRKNYFRVCRESVKGQVWSGEVRHLIATDGPCEYAEADKIISVRAIPDSRVKYPMEYADYRFATYNLFINQLMDKVEDGWIMVLDEDDQLLRPNSLSVLQPYMTDEDRIIICRFKMNNLPYPRNENFGKRLVEGDVCSPCVIFHSKHKDKAQWIGKYAGDFYAFANLTKELPVVWVDSLVAGVQRDDGRDSNGSSSDRIYRPWKPQC